MRRPALCGDQRRTDRRQPVRAANAVGGLDQTGEYRPQRGRLASGQRARDDLRGQLVEDCGPGVYGMRRARLDAAFHDPLRWFGEYVSALTEFPSCRGLTLT
jgi:hypothetical protein